MLHPGYQPPTRKQLGGKILDSIYEDLQDEAKSQLDGQNVTLCVNGWSNVNDDAIRGFSVNYNNGSFPAKTIKSGDASHNGEYLTTLVESTIQEVEGKYGCYCLLYTSPSPRD